MRRFLADGVPPGGTPEWDAWKERIVGLGSLSALRFFNYDAFLEADEDGEHYVIKAPGATTSRAIVPKIQ